MEKAQKMRLKLMQYGIDSQLADTLVQQGFGVSKIRTTSQKDLAPIVGGIKIAKEIKRAISREAIPESILLRLVSECDWSCCYCWNTDDIKPVIVHHIIPYEKTQDNNYENLVVLCPTHHADAHSKSDLTGQLLPVNAIKQKKKDFILAIERAKNGDQPFPGREPSQNYAWKKVLRQTHQQVNSTLTTLSNKYSPELYVNRDIESVFYEFSKSEKIGFFVVDQSGTGKTNLFCSLASELKENNRMVVFIRGDINLKDEYSLLRRLSEALGYGADDYQNHLNSVAQTLKQQKEMCHIFLDSVSESNTPLIVNRAISNLLAILREIGNFKVCINLRDTYWYRLSDDLPLELLFSAQTKDTKHSVNRLSSQEFEQCLAVYQQKYDIGFDPTGNAINQLSQPLLLRIFCEAYAGKSLGKIDNVLLKKTFDSYLHNKLLAVEKRSQIKYPSDFLLKALRSLAYHLWIAQDAVFLEEADWKNVLPNMSLLEQQEIFGYLESENIVEIKKNNVTLNRKIRFVFEQLQEYLLLNELLSLQPQSIVENVFEKNDFKALLSHIKGKKEVSIEDYKLLTLIGFFLPETHKRRYFLVDLLKFDFYTFCDCLSRISPIGDLNICNKESQKSFAKELRRWYEIISSSVFPDIYPYFDPWVHKAHEKTLLGISLTANIDCKEHSYNYEIYEKRKPSLKLVEVKQSESYPLFGLSIVSGEDEVVLHDPDNSFMISKIVDPISKKVMRIINQKHYPRFPGDSFNIPERFALYDVFGELKNSIEEINFPIQPIPLLVERAWVLASKIPDFKFDLLDLDFVQKQIDSLRNETSDDIDNAPTFRVQLSELNKLLYHFESINFEEGISHYDNFYDIVKSPPNIQDCEDSELLNHIYKIFNFAVSSYQVLVEENFRSLTTILNTYVNMPFEVIIGTNRDDLIYSFMPISSWGEYKYNGLIIPNEMNFSKLRIIGEDENGEEIEFNNLVVQELKKQKKFRPGIFPISQIEPLATFFSPAPVNLLVKKWLLQDLQNIFKLSAFGVGYRS